MKNCAKKALNERKKDYFYFDFDFFHSTSELFWHFVDI